MYGHNLLISHPELKVALRQLFYLIAFNPSLFQNLYQSADWKFAFMKRNNDSAFCFRVEKDVMASLDSIQQKSSLLDNFHYLLRGESW